MFSPSKSGIMSPLTLSIEKHISNITYHWHRCLRKLKWRIVTHDKNFTVSLLLEEKIINDLNTKYYFHGFFFIVLLFQIFILVLYLRKVTQNSFFTTNWLTLKLKADHSTHHWCIFYQLRLKNIKSQWKHHLLFILTCIMT